MHADCKLHNMYIPNNVCNANYRMLYNNIMLDYVYVFQNVTYLIGLFPKLEMFTTFKKLHRRGIEA